MPPSGRRSGFPSRAARARGRIGALPALAPCASMFGMFAAAAAAAQTPPPPPDLSKLSLEELMQLEVTSVSRREEPLFEAAAAITVLTQDDVRRSGATSVPELLRLVPGLEVARVNASEWAISSRGFNSQFANKLLVLIDGRTVYTPLFAGVYWDVQDLLLDDIERIEVIRGPGATLWGANAVNGVINIITRRADDVPGWAAAATGGTEEVIGSLRYGGRAGEALHTKFYAKAFDRDEFVDAAGNDAADDWRQARAGFRLDWHPGAADLWSVHGDLYAGDAGQTFTLSTAAPPFFTMRDATTDVAGGNVLGEWTHAFSPRSRTVSQVYFDRTTRDSPLFGEDRNTFDLDFQHEIAWGGRQQIVWGVGYRLTQDDIDNSFGFRLDPPERTDQLFSGFVQDEITLAPKKLRATLGSKIEHNDYTGVEVQPSARLLWTPHPRHTAWGAVSRAVRTPSRVESDVRLVVASFQNPPPDTTLQIVALVGNPELESEDLVAWELGYRVRATSRTFLDIASFYNVYDRLVTSEPQDPVAAAEPPPPHVLRPIRFGNLGSARSWGVEVSASWTVTDRFRVLAGYSWLELDVERDPASRDDNEEFVEGNDPEQQLQLRGLLDLPGAVELDAAAYLVDPVPSQNVPAYTRLDLRGEWRPSAHWRLVACGQNLLEPHHPEFGGVLTSGRATEIPRSVYGKIAWRY